MNNLFLKSTARAIAKNKRKSLSKNSTNGIKPPYLWLFTDEIKTKNILKILKRIPPNSGVIIRYYSSRKKTPLITIKKIAKRKNLIVLLAGSRKFAGDISGIHLPRWQNKSRKLTKKHYVSVSVHSMRDKRKVINNNADIIFLSPIFRTSSHKEASPLGVRRLGLLARNFSKPVIALGGINKKNIRSLISLPIDGIAAIDGLLT